MGSRKSGRRRLDVREADLVYPFVPRAEGELETVRIDEVGVDLRAKVSYRRAPGKRGCSLALYASPSLDVMTAP